MKNLKSEIDETLELSGMFGGGKLYEDKNGNPRFEGEDIKELLSGKLLSLFKQQMKEEIKAVKHQFSKNVTAHKKRNIDKGLCWDCNEPRINGWYCAEHLELHRAKSREYYHNKKLLKNIEDIK